MADLCAYCIASLDLRRNVEPRGCNDSPEPSRGATELLLSMNKTPAPVRAGRDRRLTDTTARQADIEELTSKCIAITDAVNTRQFSGSVLEQLVDERMSSGGVSVFRPVSSRADWIQDVRAMAEDWPELHLEDQDISVDLEPDGTYAKVYRWMKVTGMPPGLTRTDMTVVAWTKANGGEWRMISQIIMRGGEVLTESHAPVGLGFGARKEDANVQLIKRPGTDASERSSGGSQAHIHRLRAKIDTMAAQVDEPNDPSHFATISQLEAWSRHFVEAINTRNFDDQIFALATPDFDGGSIDVFPRTSTPEAHLDKFRTMALENPEYQMLLDDVNTDLEVGGDFARVYLAIRAVGRPSGLTRAALGVLTWRREKAGSKDCWRLVAHQSMRAPDPTSDETNKTIVRQPEADPIKVRKATEPTTRGSRLLSKIQSMAEELHPPNDSEARRKADLAKVEHLARKLVDAINTRNFNDPVFGLVSPDIRGGMEETFAPTTGFDGHMQKYLRIAEESPDYHIEVVGSSSHLELGGEFAMVYLTNRVSGRPPGMVKDAVGIYTWQRHDNAEGWWLIQNENLKTSGLGSLPCASWSQGSEDGTSDTGPLISSSETQPPSSACGGKTMPVAPAVSNVQHMGSDVKNGQAVAHESEIAKLESLSGAMVSAINSRDFSNRLFTELCSPDLVGGTIDAHGPTTTLSAHLDKFRAIISESPAYHIATESCRTDWQPGAKIARVYLEGVVTGRPPGLAREAIGIFTWERHPEVPERWWLIANENCRVLSIGARAKTGPSF